MPRMFHKLSRNCSFPIKQHLEKFATVWSNMEDENRMKVNQIILNIRAYNVHTADTDHNIEPTSSNSCIVRDVTKVHIKTYGNDSYLNES